MKKLRVYQLAKELNVDAKMLLAFLQGRGSAASSTLSMVELDEEEVARRQFGKGTGAGEIKGARLVGRVQRAQPAPAPAPPPATAPVAPAREAPAARPAPVAPSRATPVTAGVPAPQPAGAPATAVPRPAHEAPPPAASAPKEASAAPTVEGPSVQGGSEVSAARQAPARGEQAPSRAVPQPHAQRPQAPQAPAERPKAGRPQERSQDRPQIDRPQQAARAPSGPSQGKQVPARDKKAAAKPGGVHAPAPPRPPESGRRPGPPPSHGKPGRGRPPVTSPLPKGKGHRPGPGRGPSHAPAAPPAPRGGTVELPQRIVVRDLASRLGVSAAELIKQLMKQNVMATITQEIPFEVATAVAENLGFTVQRPKSAEERFLEAKKSEASQQAGKLEPRPPVVTIMGHVDHGKTTLLDVIRKSRVAAEEYGGITQHIGAYQVEVQGRRITFLDTPGHEAFTSMRARGAQVTDIAVLVVAADDGVMPQTVEAIHHARAAGVPIIVAINKVDKPGASPDRVKQQLAEHELVAEEWGGDTVMVPVSALRKQGIDELLEMILLVADLRELKAPVDQPAQGVVIEAQLDRGRGPVATVLVKEGTLKVGDPVIVGAVPGRVRALLDDRGRPLQEAGPSTPAVVLGLSDVPQPGDSLMVTPDEETARRIAQERLEKQRAEQLRPTARMTLETLSKMAAEGETRTLPIVLKADVQGSLEALQAALQQASTPQVQVNVIHAAVGGITEADVSLASASNAIIIGFNVRPDANARRLAERDRVDVRTYRIIYEAIDDVKAAMQGMLKPRLEERVLGHAEVRRTFKVPGVGTVAGCYVTDGRVVRNGSVRVVRDGVVAFEGKIASLKRFKEDVREVAEGFECGIGIERFNDVKEGDVLEIVEVVEVRQEQPVLSGDRTGA
ncbi:translation initiation factor IF-2 [Carboxydochorda subterranea]|uniref:Translation initiation factor IF-2 n=1 Tax=Carboxydichorda subterranea TaxID=3109565 RepID=A0ABZ1C0C8_9FIRM|nr:translation initiation factor IF-2 [Limnochorda sp. L945t]WRP18482.1 translation initiation factor IF-2 [Limnochorda sp. L945t]